MNRSEKIYISVNVIFLILIISTFTYIVISINSLKYQEVNDEKLVNFYISTEVVEQTNEFINAFNMLIRLEGNYIFDEDDAGKETYCGISRVYFPLWTGWEIIDKVKSSLKKNEKIEEIILKYTKKLEPHVRDFYFKQFWIPLKCQIMPNELSTEVFEQGVNIGYSQAIRHLQIVLNSLNYNFRYFKVDLAEDGIFGSNTEIALLNAIKDDSIKSIINGLNSLQGHYYIMKSRENSKKKKFIKGWLNNRVSSI